MSGIPGSGWPASGPGALQTSPSPQVTGPLNMAGNAITNLPNGVNPQDAATYGQVSGATGISGCLPGPTFGLALTTFDPRMATGAATGSAAQRLICMLVQAQESVNITTLGSMGARAGVTTGTGVNGFGIWSATGTLLANTGDMTTAFEGISDGVYVEGTISSTAITAGTYYYLGWNQNFTGTTAVIGGSGYASGIAVLNGLYSCLYYTSITSWGNLATPYSTYIDTGGAGNQFIYAR